MRAELRRTWLRLLATVAAFSLATCQAWAEDGKTDPPSGQLTTKPAALKSSAEPVKISRRSQTVIERVRVSQADQRTEVRVEGKGSLSYVESRLNQPDRLVLDFPNAFVRTQQKLIPSNLQPVRAVRIGRFKDDVARVVIDLDGVASYRISGEGNVVTVLFDSPSLVGPRVTGSEEKSVPVNAGSADLLPRPSPDRREGDTQTMSSPESPMPPPPNPANPGVAQARSSETISTQDQSAGAQTLPPPPVQESEATKHAAEYPVKDGGEPISVPPSGLSEDEYTIGLQDVLAISVWGEPELTRNVRVRPDGRISLPLIDEVKASGLTPRALQAQIAKELAAYIQVPEVTVSVQEANSHRFNILGEVQRPGSYMLAKPMTVLDAIALAGGFREFANLKKIYVLRRVPTQPDRSVPHEDVRIHVNYKEVINGVHSEQNVELEPGDTVVVP